MIVSEADDTLITITTSQPGRAGDEATECRTDMWKISKIDKDERPYYRKGERTLE